MQHFYSELPATGRSCWYCSDGAARLWVARLHYPIPAGRSCGLSQGGGTGSNPVGAAREFPQVRNRTTGVDPMRADNIYDLYSGCIGALATAIGTSDISGRRRGQWPQAIRRQDGARREARSRPGDIAVVATLKRARLSALWHRPVRRWGQLMLAATGRASAPPLGRRHCRETGVVLSLVQTIRRSPSVWSIGCVAGVSPQRPSTT